MTIADFRAYIDALCSHVLFDYNGRPCGVDPISHSRFDMWCGDICAAALSIDEVFSLPIFDGKSLSQIYDSIQNME